MTLTIEQATVFFVQHAGFSYNPKTETPEQGRLRCARELAEAEAWARDNGLSVEWTADWDGDHSYTEQAMIAGYTVTTCESAALVNADGDCFASLGCIDDASDEYRRVIEAELADEAKDAADKEAARLAAIVPDTYATDQIDRVMADEREGLARKGLPLEDETYQLQISPNHAFQPTNHMNITPAELTAIRAILARRTVAER